jgi:ribose 5-phosphate isomerase A
MITPAEIKKSVARYAVDSIKTGMTIGLGTGSTVYWLIQELGKRIQQGLEITVVPTSVQTKQLAKDAGLAVEDLDGIATLALTIDGADEIDLKGQLIKGGGGALLQEKIVAAASAGLVIIADASKLVLQLGKFPLPIEVIPFGHKQVQQKIIDSGLCSNVILRQKDGRPFITDHHHYILDCQYNNIVDAVMLNNNLHNIPGIVETGLFINMANRAIVGYADGRIETITYR